MTEPDPPPVEFLSFIVFSLSHPLALKLSPTHSNLDSPLQILASIARCWPVMATAIILPSHEKRQIFDLASICEALFLEYADPDRPFPEPRRKAELQLHRFYVWASNLAAFASFKASLDKRLECSDEIQNLVVRLLSLMRRNLEFGMS